MKRVVLAVLLIFCSFVLSLVAHFYIINVSTELEKLLEAVLAQAPEEADNINTENISLALEKWNRHGKFFGVLLRNSASGEIDKVFGELDFFLNYPQGDSLKQAAAKCVILLKGVKENEKFSFDNIF